MSKTIDERVVEMRFDANQFNQNISSSIQSINKLNSSIDGMSKGTGLLDLGKAAEKLDFSKAEFSATHAGFHIQDVFEKATRFLENNIAKRIVDFGTNIGKSLTIEPVFTGFNEYEQKMGSVQTIMNGANVGLEKTMDTLEELNKYADKTIYSFSDMTNSIAKFVNAGVDLDDAVMAIKGISNEAAVSGASAAESGRAMYNIAQALSTGSMKLVDWKSIENANMATQEFKKTLIETGVELNAIRSGKNGNSKLTAEELLADPSKFRASIEGVKGQTWVTDKVMIEALKKYADETTEFGKKAYAAAQDVKTFTMLMDTLKEAAQSGWAVSMENVIGNFEEAKQMWTAVNNEIGGLLDKSSDARNKLLEEWKKGGGRQALLDSVSNIWFTLKDTISGVKDAFRDVFPAMSSQQLIGLTKGFETFTARIREFMASAQTMGTIKNVFSGFFKAINSIKSAISQMWSAGKSVFGNITTAFRNTFSISKEAGVFSAGLVKIGEAVENIGNKVNNFFRDSKNSENLTKVFEGMFSAIDLVRKGIVTLGNVVSNILSPIFGNVSGFGSGFLEIAGKIGEFITYINNGTSAFKNLSELGNGLKKIADSAISTVKGINIIDGAFDLVSKTLEKLRDLISGIEFGDTFKNFKLPKISFGGIENPGPIIKSLEVIRDTITSVFSSLSKNLGTNDVLKPLFDFYNGLTGVLNGLLTVATSLLNAIRSLFDGFADMMDTAPFLTISLIFNNILNFIKLLETGFSIGAITQTFQKLAGVLDNFGDAFEGWLNESLAKAAKNFAIAIAIIAGALVVLTTVDPGRLLVATVALAAVATGLRRAITSLSDIKFDGFDTIRKSFSKLSMLGQLTTSIIKFSVAIAIVALALRSIGDLDIVSMGAALLSVIILMQALVKVAEKLSGMDPGKMTRIGFAMIEFSVGVRILASAINALGQLSLGQAAIGLVSIIVAMVALEQVAKRLGSIDTSSILKTAVALMAFSVAVRLIASAVTAMGEMGMEGVVAGLVGITVILGELVFAAKILGESQSAVQAAVVLLALSVSIGILGHALSTFGNMSSDQLTQGMYAIIVAVGAMLAIARLLPEEFNRSAIALLAAAVALNIVASAVQSFGGMDFLSMMQGLLGLGASMAILVVGLKMLEGSLAGAAAMVIVSAGLIALGIALRIIGDMSLAAIGKGLIGLAGGLIIMAVAMTAMIAALPGAIALTVAAVGLLALAGALAILGSLSFADVLTGLFALAAALTILGVATLLLTPILIPMAALAGILLLLSASVAIVGLGLTMIGEALIVLSSNGMAGVIFLKEFSQALMGIIPLSAYATVTLTALSTAFLALTVALMAFSVALIASGAGLAVVGAGLLVLSVGLSAIAVSAIVCAAAFAAIAGNLGATVDILNNFSGDFLNAGKELITSFINGIKGMVNDAIDAVKNVGKSILGGFKSAFGIGDDGVCKEAYDSGKSVGDSYKKGLEDSKPEVESAAEDFGGGMMDKIKESFGNKLDISPDMLINTENGDISKMLGVDLDVSSLNSGLEDTKGLTGDSALNMEKMADGSMDTDALLKEMGADSSVLAGNTDTAADNVNKISKTDVSNVEALSKANVDGLTDPKQQKELDKTKEKVDAISKSVDETKDKKIKPEVDTSDLDKLVNDVMHGKYGNGMERMIALAERYGEVQNKVNEKLGSSKRYEVGVDYSKKGNGKTVNDGVPRDIYGRTLDEIYAANPGLKINEELDKLQTAYANIIQSKAPESEKEAIRKRVADQTRIWSEYWKKTRGTLESTGMHDSREGMYAYRDGEQTGYYNAKSADDAGVREAQLKRLKEYQQQGKTVAQRNEELLASFRNLGNTVETASTSLSKVNSQLGIQHKVEIPIKADTKEVEKIVPTVQATVASTKNSQINVPVKADTKEIQGIPTQVQEIMRKSQSQTISVPVKADTKEVTGIPTQVQEAMRNAQQVNIPVKADSKEVKQATTDVDNLKKSTDQVKDKKVTISADAKGAVTAVDQFGKSLTKMSQAVDIETSKSKQSFAKFYTALQQTINTYTPTVIANFKSTFEMAINQTMNYLRSGSIMSQFRSIGVNMGRGLTEGLKSQVGNVRAAAKELSNAAVVSTKNTLKVHSPSQVFYDIAKFCGVALSGGLRDSISDVSKASEDLGESAISSAMSIIGGLDLDSMDLEPTIRPVLDTSDIEAQSGSIDALLNRNNVARISAEYANGSSQQQVRDQQMADQLQLLNQKIAELTEAAKNPVPVNVNTDVTLQGDSKKFFEAMRTEDRRYQQTRGKSAFAST